MTRKDFVLIADILAEVIENHSETINGHQVVTVSDLIAEFADALKVKHDNFDHPRFVAYVEKGAGL